MKPLLLCFLIVANVRPVQGQKESPQADSHEESAKSIEKSGSKIPSPVLNSIDQNTSNQEKNGSKDDPQSYFARLFSPENLPNIGLFIAGVVGIIVALRTLKTMNKQTADAYLNTQAFINSERARVIAELLPVYHRDENRQWRRDDGALLRMEQILRGEHNVYRLRIINVGRTPAHIFNYEIRYGPFLEGSHFSHEGLENARFVNINAFLENGQSSILEELNVPDIFAPEINTGAFCVSVKYGDIITGREQHETSVVYRYRDKDSSLDRITVCDKYT